MSVRKRKGHWEVAHCRGKDKGKTIAKHKTKASAVKQHKAITRAKHRKRQKGK